MCMGVIASFCRKPDVRGTTMIDTITWSQSNYPSMLGVEYIMCTGEQLQARICPPHQDILVFVMEFLDLCIIQNAKSCCPSKQFST